MMKRLIIAIFALALPLFIMAQTAEQKTDSITKPEANAQPWKCSLFCKDHGTKLVLDLYKETVEVPGMDMFGPMNGYLGGNIFGVWMLTTFEIKDNTHAILRLSNDLGSDTQECLLTIQPDGTYRLDLKGAVYVKKVVNKKLVKVDNLMIFNKQ